MSIFTFFLVLVIGLYAESITINPGDDIQSAINKLHSSGGGTLTLNKGTYIIKE